MANIETEYKTISQIQTETEKALYYRSFDYARAVALTTFLRELESRHGDDFRLLTANPKYLYDRSIKDAEEMKKTKAFAIGLWARWKIGKTEYYILMDKNLFFDAWISRSWRLDNENLQSEYVSHMNDILYNNTNLDAEPETILQLIQNIHNAFNITNKRQAATYIKKIPAYERVEKQTIYKN